MAEINLLDVLNESVNAGLSKAYLRDTPQNRVNILLDMHKSLTGNTSSDVEREMVRTIEDEIIRLQDELP